MRVAMLASDIATQALFLYFEHDGDLRFLRLAAEACALASAACELALA